MENINKPGTIAYRLLGIDLLEFSLKNSEIVGQKDIYTYHTQVNLEHKINEQNRIIIVVPSVSILYEDNKTLLATIKVSLIFEFESLEGFKSDTPNSFDFPEDLIINLNSVSISTLRGIMFTLFRGTFLHKAVLPLIDPRTLAIDEMNK